MFAHGPWYGEWHHIPDLVMGIPAAFGVAVYWLREKFRR